MVSVLQLKKLLSKHTNAVKIPNLWKMNREQILTAIKNAGFIVEDVGSTIELRPLSRPRLKVQSIIKTKPKPRPKPKPKFKPDTPKYKPVKPKKVKTTKKKVTKKKVTKKK